MQLLINHVGKREFQSACVEEALQKWVPEAMELVAATALRDLSELRRIYDMFALLCALAPRRRWCTRFWWRWRRRSSSRRL